MDGDDSIPPSRVRGSNPWTSAALLDRLLWMGGLEPGARDDWTGALAPPPGESLPGVLSAGDCPREKGDESAPKTFQPEFPSLLTTDDSQPTDLGMPIKPENGSTGSS